MESALAALQRCEKPRVGPTPSRADSLVETFRLVAENLNARTCCVLDQFNASTSVTPQPLGPFGTIAFLDHVTV